MRSRKSIEKTKDTCDLIKNPLQAQRTSNRTALKLGEVDNQLAVATYPSNSIELRPPPRGAHAINNKSKSSITTDSRRDTESSLNCFSLSLRMFKKLMILTCLMMAVTHVSTDWSSYLDIGACLIRECCHSNDGRGYIKYEKGCDNLLQALKTKVYGQPLITKPIYRSLKWHVSNDRPPRPLVMYFSGWTGTGKTYVAKLIASSLYEKGMDSRFVKYISSSLHFPVKIESDQDIVLQRQRLRDMIKDVVSQCGRSLIILDELDKLPSGVVDALQPMLDYVDDVDGVQYNKAIFIFLSNTGAQTLNRLSYKMFQEGKERQDLSSKDIEDILISESHDEPGGLRHSALLRRYSIGVFVPFLPLERQHVKACIKNEIENSHVIPDDLDRLIEDIADEMTYFPEHTPIYSKSGCKGVSEKVVNNIGSQSIFERGKEEKRVDYIVKDNLHSRVKSEL